MNSDSLSYLITKEGILTGPDRTAVAYRRGGGFGVFNPPPPPPKFRSPSKIVPNSTRLLKLLKIAEFRTSTLKMFGKNPVKF